MSTEQLVVVGDAMRGVGLFHGDLVLYDRAKLPSPGCCVVALHEGELIVRLVQGRPPRVSLVATDGITPPIWFGQGSDPEILGVVTVGVHHLVDKAPMPNGGGRSPQTPRHLQDHAIPSAPQPIGSPLMGRFGANGPTSLAQCNGKKPDSQNSGQPPSMNVSTPFSGHF